MCCLSFSHFFLSTFVTVSHFKFKFRLNNLYDKNKVLCTLIDCIMYDVNCITLKTIRLFIKLK